MPTHFLPPLEYKQTAPPLPLPPFPFPAQPFFFCFESSGSVYEGRRRSSRRRFCPSPPPSFRNLSRHFEEGQGALEAELAELRLELARAREGAEHDSRARLQLEAAAQRERQLQARDAGVWKQLFAMLYSRGGCGRAASASLPPLFWQQGEEAGAWKT